MYSSTLICIVVACRCMGVPEHLFLCSYSRQLINIELHCTDDTRINIVDAWGFRSTSIYPCTYNNTSTQPEGKHGLRNSLWQRLFTNCVDQNHCNFIYYPPMYLKDNITHGIAVKYKCVPDNKFIRFCHRQNTSIEFQNDVNLIFKNSVKKCSCEVEANGRFHMSLTQFPTNSGYLTVKETGGMEKSYRDQVVINQRVNDHVNDKTRQTFVVMNDFREHKKHVPFILINFSVKDRHGDLHLKCTEQWTKEIQKKKPEVLATEQPSPESSPTALYVITAVITAAVSLVIIVACVTIAYHCIIKRKGIKISEKGKVSTSKKSFTRSLEASISTNHDERLTGNHSYAEIGSICDYRHYVLPDDTSLKSVRMKIRLGKLEGVASRGSSSYSNPQEYAMSQVKRQTQQDANNADKTDTENSATIRDAVCSTMPPISESTENVLLTDDETNTEQCSVLSETTDKKKQEREQKTEREDKTISGERYDPAGYLDLDITETTNHHYLQKWIKDIYSVEQKAKQAMKEGKGEEIPPVGRRRVLVKNEAKQPDNCYSNPDDHKIAFSDEEALFHK